MNSPESDLPAPNRFEDAGAGAGPLGQVLARASREARSSEDPGGHATAVDVGASVVGQAFSAFLLGARARCRELGIEQVAFIARDGHLPYLMATSMDPEFWAGIDLHYVHGNRLTWALAGARTLGLADWLAMGSSDDGSFLVHHHRELSPRALVTRLGVELEELPSDLPLASLPPDEPLGDNAAAWTSLLATIPTESRLTSLIEERAAERQELAAAYLSTVGLQPGSIMLLDIGWRGQSAVAVSPIFADLLGQEPLHYHFGGVGVRPSIDAQGRIERYAFDDQIDPLPFGEVVHCIEMITGAGEPRALRYTARPDGTAEPVFDQGVPEMASPERDRIWSAARSTAAALPFDQIRDRFEGEVPNPAGVLEALRLFWQQPTPDQAALGTRLRMEVDELGQSVLPVAAPYGAGEVRRRRPRRWREASVTVSPAPVRLAFSALSAARSVQRR
jgi:hypothetical protein